jgi:hypothetical protein
MGGERKKINVILDAINIDTNEQWGPLLELL